MKWQDLIDVPFVRGGRDPATGLDCLGVAYVVNARRGADVPTAFDGRAASLDDLDGIFRMWERRGASPMDADEVGDVVLSRAEGELHVTTIVQVLPRLALTTSRSTGVRETRPRLVVGPLGSYRLRRP